MYSLLILEIIIASTCYVTAFFVVSVFLMPIQDMFLPEFTSFASLIFLPHGVRVLTAWLLGWRSIIALLPGVALTYYIVGGMNIFLPSRLTGIAIAVLVTPVVFALVKRFVADLSPAAGSTPCWPCIMAVGALSALISGFLTNLAFGSPLQDYFAYFIGDIVGLFSLMLALMLGFRIWRRHFAS